MRHYIVDPDNEERLLKVPTRVVAAIKAEAFAEVVEALTALCAHTKYEGCLPCPHDDAVAAIKGLGGEQ